MSFDIGQPLFDEYGEFDEDAWIAYGDELMTRFSASPEGQQVVNEQDGIGWAYTFMDYGIRYLGVAPPTMSSSTIDEILLDIFPAKVSADRGAGPEIMRELRAFWAFLEREFQLENAPSILTTLQGMRDDYVEREMQNPANFGMAKSFYMLGKQTGFDMTTEQGLQEFTAIYNAAMSSSSDLPIDPLLDLPSQAGRHHMRHGSKHAMARRKMAKSSRRKNRKK